VCRTVGTELLLLLPRWPLIAESRCCCSSRPKSSREIKRGVELSLSWFPTSHFDLNTYSACKLLIELLLLLYRPTSTPHRHSALA
jgi:hypothetical protein